MHLLAIGGRLRILIFSISRGTDYSKTRNKTRKKIRKPERPSNHPKQLETSLSNREKDVLQLQSEINI